MQNFKVGDWVILNEDKQTLAKVLEIYNEYIFKCRLHFINEGSVVWCSEMSYYKHWRPTEGEWCWFWNFNEMPTLEQFREYHDLDDYLGNYETLTVKLYQHCEPFIGELPTFLKENT